MYLADRPISLKCRLSADWIQKIFTFQMYSYLAGLENYRVWFKFELIHCCKWDSEKREVRVGPAIREGFLEERDLIGGSGKGRGEQRGRKHSGSWDIAHASAGSNHLSTGTGQEGAPETGVCKPEMRVEFHLISLSPTEK